VKHGIAGALSLLALSLVVLRCTGATSPPQVLYHNRLESLDGLIGRDGLVLENELSEGRNGVRIEARGPTVVPLADVQTKPARAVVLTYRGHLRAADLKGRAYLEMRCRIAGEGEMISKALDTAVTGTSGWVTQSLGNEQHAQRVRLNVQIEGSGVVWVHNVLLAQGAR
jgi:hypothetical protein